jgi:hypothetical protein
MPEIWKVSALHARSVSAFLNRLPSLNTASVAGQRFYTKHLLLGYRYFDILLLIELDWILRNTGWVEGRDYRTHEPGRQNDGPGWAEHFQPFLSYSDYVCIAICCINRFVSNKRYGLFFL